MKMTKLLLLGTLLIPTHSFPQDSPVDEIPLIVAAQNNDLEEVELLIEAGTNLNMADSDGRTALMYAAWNGHFIIIQKLVEGGAYLNIKDNSGWMALRWAVAGAHHSKDKGNYQEVIAYLRFIRFFKAMPLNPLYGP